MIKTLFHDWLVLFLTVLVACVYSFFSFAQHYHFQTNGFDLGIFDQVVWHYSRFEIPESTIRGVPTILGDHFSPILVVLAPVYWLAPSPYTLLFVQACLFAATIVPVYFFCKKRLGRYPAFCFASAFATFWGVLTAVAFDFHEVSFATFLIGWCIYFLDNRRWSYSFICLFLLLFVKEDMPALVFFVGLYILGVKKQLWLGLNTITLGFFSYFFIMRVCLPFFIAPGAQYDHWSYSQFGSGAREVVQKIITQPYFFAQEFLNPVVKRQTIVAIFLPFLFFPFLSPLLFVSLPLFFARFLSTNQLFWVEKFHYTAVLSPIVAMAAADGVFRLSHMVRSPSIQKICLYVLSTCILGVNILKLPQSPFWQEVGFYLFQKNQSDITGYEALRRIPQEASVAAQGSISPHLSQRAHIYQIDQNTPETEYVVASMHTNPWPFTDHLQIQGFISQKEHAGYQKIFSQDGWVVLKRGK